MDSWRWRCHFENCDNIHGQGTYDEINAQIADHIDTVGHAVTYVETQTMEPPLAQRMISAITDAIVASLPTVMPTATADETQAVADATTQAASDALLLQED